MFKILFGLLLIAIVQSNRLYDVTCEQCIAGGNTQCLSDANYVGLPGDSCCAKGSKDNFCRFA